MIRHVAALLLLASPAAAERIFPSLEPYRSETVELHLAWGAPGSPAGQMNGGGNDRYDIFGGGDPTGLRAGSSNGAGPGSQSGPGNGGTTTGPGGLRGGGV
jgi:hypothetical protein